MPIPNHFTYNVGDTIPGTIQKGCLSIATIDREYGGDTASTPGNKVWYNGRVIDNNLVIYTDSYSIGRTSEDLAAPVIKKTDTTDLTDLLNLINQLPNRPQYFDDFSTAFEWFQNESIYIIQNKPLPTFITDSLKYCYDVSFFGCYPRVGDKIWNLANQVCTSTLKGDIFNPDFEGIISTNGSIDEYLITNNLSLDLSQSFTFIIWLRFNSSGVILSEQDTLNLYEGFRYSLLTINDDNKFGFSIYTTMGLQGFVETEPRNINTWYQIAISYDDINNQISGYVNGELVGSLSEVVKENSETGNKYYLFGAACDISLNAGSTNSGIFDFSFTQIHDDILTDELIYQNYQLTKDRFS